MKLLIVILCVAVIALIWVLCKEVWRRSAAPDRKVRQ